MTVMISDLRGALSAAKIYDLAHFLEERGIQILEAPVRDGVSGFVFAAIPVKVSGGTGSPVSPLALVGAASGAAVD